MCETNYELRRGNVHWVKDHFYDDSESSTKEDSYHPYLIISSDKANMGNSSNVTVMMLTSNLNTITMPTHVLLNGYKNLKPSVVKTENIHTIPKSYIGDRICSLRQGDLLNVEHSMKIAFSLSVDEEE